MKNIEFEQLVMFHKKIVLKTGGSSGIRDEGLLKSALGRGNMTFGGNELHQMNEK